MTRLSLFFLLFAVILAAGCSPGPDGPECVPVPEECNNADDDCDGYIDENDGGGPLRRDCSNACGPGEEECQSGEWVFCNAPQPSEERCNGFDDDCDGRIDDSEACGCVHGTTQSCGTDEGECELGVRHCTDGEWGECLSSYDPAEHPEECDGLDNDCDGQIDEDCNCEPGAVQACGTDEGECSPGTLTCSADGSWSTTCEGEVEPTVDVCDGLDNDCDGMADHIVSIDFGWSGDDFENNGECGDASPLYSSSGRAELVEEGGWVSPEVSDPSDITTYPTLYPAGDEDWYYTRAVEGRHSCVPWTSQCSFVLDAQLELLDRRYVEGVNQEPEDWTMCLHLADCAETGSSRFCTQGTNWDEDHSSYLLSVVWGGSCGSDDSREVKIRVYSPTGAACGHYQVFTQFRYDREEPCP